MKILILTLSLLLAGAATGGPAEPKTQPSSKSEIRTALSDYLKLDLAALQNEDIATLVLGSFLQLDTVGKVELMSLINTLQGARFRLKSDSEILKFLDAKLPQVPDGHKPPRHLDSFFGGYDTGIFFSARMIQLLSPEQQADLGDFVLVLRSIQELKEQGKIFVPGMVQPDAGAYPGIPGTPGMQNYNPSVPNNRLPENTNPSRPMKDPRIKEAGIRI